MAWYLKTILTWYSLNKKCYACMVIELFIQLCNFSWHKKYTRTLLACTLQMHDHVKLMGNNATSRCKATWHQWIFVCFNFCQMGSIQRKSWPVNRDLMQWITDPFSKGILFLCRGCPCDHQRVCSDIWSIIESKKSRVLIILVVMFALIKADPWYPLLGTRAIKKIW